MSVTLKQSNVSLGNGFDPMLNNLQANILKFHGRNFAYHLFFVLDKYKTAEAKYWIREFASHTIVSAHEHLDAARTYKEYGEDGGAVYNLSLSYSGCEKLDAMPDIDNSAAFKNGLRGSADLLKDKPDNWQDEFKNQIDMLIIVADDDATEALQYANDIIEQTKPFATCVLSQRGNVLKMKDTGVGIEHFSYADGVSQPMYLQDEITTQNNKNPQLWTDETPLERVLVKENGSAEDDCFGSYLVFRKLEQHVADFKKNEGDDRGDDTTVPDDALLPRVKDEFGEDNVELPGAMIVGRFENSVPVIKKSRDKDDENDPNPAADIIDNDFDYAGDLGLKCPYHAHIRLMNPRKGDPKEKAEDLLTHRITRRGITFDDHTTPFDETIEVNHRKRFADDAITAITNEQLEKENQPKDGVGLLFMCYQTDIANQFEVLQAFWANQGLVGGPPVKGQDSIITQGTDLYRSLPQQWGQPLRSRPFHFSGFVEMRGGEYFYTPSIPFLTHL